MSICTRHNIHTDGASICPVCAREDAARASYTRSTEPHVFSFDDMSDLRRFFVDKYEVSERIYVELGGIQPRPITPSLAHVLRELTVGSAYLIKSGDIEVNFSIVGCEVTAGCTTPLKMVSVGTPRWAR